MSLAAVGLIVVAATRRGGDGQNPIDLSGLSSAQGGVSDDLFDTPSEPQAPTTETAETQPTVEILPQVQPKFDPAADMLVAGLAELAATTPSLAGFGDPKYTQCLNTALANGGLGLAAAEAWLQEGGDTAALHCLAYAHQSRGDFEEAGTQFEIVGARLRAYSPEFAATVFASGGQAFGSAATALAEEAQGSGGGEATRAITERAIAALERAFQLYDTSLGLDTREPAVPTDYALLMADFGYSVEALELLNETLAKSPTFAPALFTKGLIERQRGATQDARLTFQRVIQTNPQSPYATEAREELESLNL